MAASNEELTFPLDFNDNDNDHDDDYDYEEDYYNNLIEKDHDGDYGNNHDYDPIEDGWTNSAQTDDDGDARMMYDGEYGNNYDNHIYHEYETQDGQKNFIQYYCTYPLSHIEKSNLEAGNKIILPLSALDRLMDIGVQFPMMFKIENPSNGRTSHCGVLEFSGEEGMAFMPDWMIKNMSLEIGDLVNIKSVTLSKATYIKLQPHTTNFLDIQNPKDVLETSFCGGYSCLTVGDTILIIHQGKKYYLDVVDAKPLSAVCIIETDCEVDFAPPLDYKVPAKQALKTPTKEVKKTNKLVSDKGQGFKPFTGKKYKLTDF